MKTTETSSTDRDRRGPRASSTSTVSSSPSRTAARVASSLVLLGTVFLLTGPGAYAAQQLPNVPGPLTGPVLPAPPSAPPNPAAPSSSISGGLTGTLPAPAPVPATGWVSVGADTPLWLDAAGKIPLGIAPAGTTLQQLGGSSTSGPSPSRIHTPASASTPR